MRIDSESGEGDFDAKHEKKMILRESWMIDRGTAELKMEAG